MQILALAIYNAQGDRRDVKFKPGRLNIVTGESRTGKSALLDMVEYCLGRDTIMMPVGPITSTVVWYACLFELAQGGRVFVARPAPRGGAASTQQAMLEFGGPGLELLSHDQLVVNCDTRSLREQLGGQVGIEENLHEPGEWTQRAALEAHIGHAALLCLQGQVEVANRQHLFHRQSEPGMEQTLKDTLPYFLGAVAKDVAVRRLQMREAKRELTRLSSQLAAAEAAAESAEGQLRALATEAVAVGLMQPVADDADRRVVLAALELASRRESVDDASTPVGVDSIDASEQRVALIGHRRDLYNQLRAVTAERRLLLEAAAEEGEFQNAAAVQAARLASIELLPSATDDESDSATCPVCASPLARPDPEPLALAAHLATLRSQLAGLDATRPSRRGALADLENRAVRLREELRTLDAALQAIVEGDELVDETDVERRGEFTRGRISAILGVSRRVDETEIGHLRRRIDAAERRLSSLEAELDDDESAMLLDSRLLEISADMTGQAQQLSLEHSGRMRLDLAKLTVITETDHGPAPLWRVGSAENWIGAHVVAHLALHRFFVRHDRPVPRFLMLDQPTQAWYPSEVDEWDGVPVGDSDREAVRAIFRLLLDVVTDLAPSLQVIVCDHANLPEDWFQESVEHNWRGGEKLVPDDWNRA